jgi:hypothetical protein
MIPASEEIKNEREELASKGVDRCDSYCMGHTQMKCCGLYIVARERKSLGRFCLQLDPGSG